MYWRAAHTLSGVQIWTRKSCPRVKFRPPSGPKLRNRQVSTMICWFLPAPVQRVKHPLNTVIVAINERVIKDDRSGLAALREHDAHGEANRHRYLFLGTIRQPVKRLCPLAFDVGDGKTVATSDWRSGGWTRAERSTRGGEALPADFNSADEGQFVATVELVADSIGGVRFRINVENLIAGLWWQLGQKLVGSTIVRQCSLLRRSVGARAGNGTARGRGVLQ